MGRLQGKIALITGASAGIGRASARLFASEGAVLGLFDINEKDGGILVREICDAGGVAKFFKVDVSNADEQHAAIDECANALVVLTYSIIMLEALRRRMIIF